jgi:hypothetical protein
MATTSRKWPLTPSKGLLKGTGPYQNYTQYKDALDQAKSRLGIKRIYGRKGRPSMNGLTFRQRLAIYNILVESGVGNAKAADTVEAL